jgi:hypothetical protein
LPSGDGTNSGEFVVSSDGLTVTDTITGLVWQRDGSGARTRCSGASSLTCTWAEATAYCADLTLGGLTGWRLPAQSELVTIADFTKTDPAIDQTVFPSTTSNWYWTSSLYAGSSGSAWEVEFDTGGNAHLEVSYTQRVRCVR